MDYRSTRKVEIVHLNSQAPESDQVCVEEPLQLRLVGPPDGPTPIAVTLRTPGDDLDLVTGLLFTEGYIDKPDEIEDLSWGDPFDFNTLDVTLRYPLPSYLEPNGAPRFINSACGACSKTTLSQIASRSPVSEAALTVPRDLVVKLPDQLRLQQEIFDATGGIHGAGLFDCHGNPVVVKEDVGRHNALDKAIGWVFRNVLSPHTVLESSILCVSGRVGFEIVYKAARAQVSTIIAVSAASSMAIDLAGQLNMTLAGFTRSGESTIYCGEFRLR